MRLARWLVPLLLALPVGALEVGDAAAPLFTVGPPAAAGPSEPVPLTGFRQLPSGIPSPAQPTATIARDAARLIVTVHVPLGRPAAAPPRPHDGPVWQDDAVELFLDPGHTQKDYYQFVVSAASAMLEGHGHDLAWNGAWQGTAKPTADGYDAVLTVPFAAISATLPAADAVWGFNLCVDRPGQPPLSWSPVQSGFHDPERFGLLRFSPDAAAGLGSLGDWLGAAGPVQVVTRGKGVAGRASLAVDGVVTPSVFADANGAIAVAMPREGRFAKPGSYELRVMAERPNDKLPLLRWSATREVGPPLSLTAKAFLEESVLRTEATVEPGAIDRGRLIVRFGVGPEGAAPTVTHDVPVPAAGPASVAFAEKELPQGKIQVSARLLEAGQSVAEAAKVLDQPLDPPWLNDRTGISEEVPAPWTPMAMFASDDGNRTVSCWGRLYDFGGGVLPRSVNCREQELLAGPITLATSRHGKTLAWGKTTSRVTGATPAAVELTATSTSPGLGLSGAARMEYDGMLRVDVDLTPVGATPPDGLVLEIPLRAEHAKYLYHFPGAWGSVQNAGALPAAGWHNAWKPYVWLGDDDHGFAWWCESQQNWSPAKEDQAITIDREGERVMLRLHLNEGKPITAPLHYTFGFQATPVKAPEQDVWDYRFHHGGNYTLPTTPYAPQAEVVYPAKGNVDPAKGTFEAWIQLLFDSDPALPQAEKAKQGNRNLFTLRFPDNSNAGLYWNELHQGPVAWSREAGEVKLYAGGSVKAKKGEWHHLVFTWGDAARAWLDGKLLFEQPHQGLIARNAADGQIVLGGSGSQFVVDELRILDLPTGPDDGAKAYEPDAHTLLLEHFDTLGAGKTQPAKGTPGEASHEAALVPGHLGQGLQLGGDHPQRTQLDRLAEAGVRTVCFHEHWTPWQSHPYTTAENEPKLKALVDAVHGKQMQLLLYMSRQIADTAPEYELYSDDILTLPKAFSYTREPKQEDWGVCWRSRWKNFCLYHLARTMDRFGNDGWYLDGPEWPCPCTNRHHGCGYVKPDGTIGATYDIFATREFMRRLYVMTRQRKPAGQLNIHNSTVMTIPTLSWGTSRWDGEQIGSIPRGTKPFLEILPLDAFRCEMMTRQWGVPAELLCYERPWTSHELLAYGLVHDVLVRPNGYDEHLDEVSALWRAADKFGRKGATWLPYWSNQAALQPSDAAVKISAYTRPGAALLVIANLSEQARTAGVRLDLGKLGLPAGAKATNALTGKAIPLTDHALSLVLNGFDYALIDVR